MEKSFVPIKIENITNYFNDWDLEKPEFFLPGLMSFYEDYEGLAKGIVLLCDSLKKKEKYQECLSLVELFTKLCINDKDQFLLEEQSKLNSILIHLKNSQQLFLESNQAEYLKQICQDAFCLNETVLSVVSFLAEHRQAGNCDYVEDIKAPILDNTNIGFLAELLCDETRKLCIIVEDETQCVNYDALAYMITMCGHKVMRLAISESANKSEDVLNDDGDNIVQLFCREDDLHNVIKSYCSVHSKDGFALLLGTGNRLDLLSSAVCAEFQIARLSNTISPVLEDKITFGWCGNYLSYISRIYKMDVKSEIEMPSKCRFSVVIPAKNSAETLRYTLLTCLNQRWDGAFEIVVSDNSTEGNMAVKELCDSMEDTRIRYIKAPRPLIISRSFEYAFLKAKGEFIIALGSDDGLLPWTFEVLDNILARYPDKLMMWDRGQYQWPDYGCGISDRLDFSGVYEYDKIDIGYIDGVDFICNTILNENNMYLLPLCYINSGFRREYISTLLEKTGALWDGPCHDIYTGVVNSCINQKICMIKYPLTIAGMTRKSTGATYNRHLTTLDSIINRNENWKNVNYIGGWARTQMEKMIPHFTTDVSILYHCLLRAAAKKILSQEIITEVVDWKRWFMGLYKLMNKKDLSYERQLRELRYAAKLQGESFLEWFDKNIFTEGLELEEVQDELGGDAKNYVQGVAETCHVVLDASRYGVTNIYEAVKLMEKVSGL